MNLPEIIERVRQIPDECWRVSEGSSNDTFTATSPKGATVILASSYDEGEYESRGEIHIGWTNHWTLVVDGYEIASFQRKGGTHTTQTFSYGEEEVLDLYREIREKLDKRKDNLVDRI